MTPSTAPSSRDSLLPVMRDAIRTLRDQQRTVLALHYVERLPLSQIAPVLGVTTSRVGRIHRNALQALRDALPTPQVLAS